MKNLLLALCIFLLHFLLPAQCSFTPAIMAGGPVTGCGNVVLSVSPAVSGYTYSWSTGASGTVISVGLTAAYTVTVTDLSGCQASATQTTALAPNPNITVTGSSICFGQTATLTASGAGTYTWSANAGGSTQNTVVLNPTVTTNYTVSATTGSCTVSFPVRLNVNSLPAVAIAVSGSTLGCGARTLSTNPGNDTWTQRTGLSTARNAAVAFSIRNRGYIATGNTGSTLLNDLWEYDPVANTWTQKANFAGGARYGAVGFSIGGKGYLGTGDNGNVLLNDFWEYDPAGNIWTAKASFGGTPRSYAVGFNIGNKGYIGTGSNTSVSPYIYSDFWEYDPSGNTWTQKAAMSTGRYFAAGFAIGTKGYIGTGLNSGYLSDFWEYDPAANTWSSKAAFGGGGAISMTGFNIGNKGYFGAGIPASTGISGTMFWEYNPAGNLWLQKTNFAGSARDFACGFSIGNTGYMGMGTGSSAYKSDFWQYDPNSSIAWSTGAYTPSISVAASGSYSVTLTTVAGCTASTSQSLSLTPNPTVAIGGATAICNGSSATLTASGAASYSWSSNAAGATVSTVVITPTLNTTYSVTGATSGCTATATRTLTVNSIPPVGATASGSVMCYGSNLTLSGSGANSYTWSPSAPDNTSFTPSASAVYTVTGSDLNNCTNTAVVSVTVNPVPTVAVSGGTLCAGESFSLSPSGALSYNYSGGNAVVSPTTTTSYTVSGFNSYGCQNTIPAVATVSLFAAPVIAANGTLICLGDSYVIAPTGASTYTYSGGSPTVSPGSDISYYVTGTSTAGCVSLSPAVVSITVAALPVITVNSGSVCAGQNFTLSPGGAATYTYLNGAPVVTPGPYSTYSVTGTSTAGCVSPLPGIATVVAQPLPTVTVNSGSICSGGSFTLNPAGAATYTISGGSATVSPAGTTSYTVTGTSTAGCVSPSPAISSITVVALPLISVNSGSVCSGQSFTIVPSGASTYTISGGLDVVTPAASGSYSVTGTGSSGCISAAAAISQVTVYTTPTLSLPAGTLICANQPYTISPSGATAYTISGGSAIVSPSVNTSYTVSGASAAGCYAQDAVLSLSVQPSLSLSISGATAACQGHNVTLTANGAASHTWSTGSGAAAIVVAPPTSTVYTISAESGVCQASASLAITIHPNPTVSAQSSESVICRGTSVSISASGAATYSWNEGSGTQVIVVTPTMSTTYTVTGISNAGCTGTAALTQSVSACTEISDTEQQIAIRAYPNPGKGWVLVECALFAPHAVLELYNASGQLVLQKNAEGSAQELNFEWAPNGLYTLCVKINGRTIYAGKLVKQD